MTTFFNIFKKPVFGIFLAYFPIFEAKTIFLEILALSHITSYGFLASCQNLEKTKDTIPRKRPERWKDGRKPRQKDGQTLFHRTLLGNA